MTREELFGIEEVEEAESIEETIDIRLSSRQSYYLENKEEIEAYQRYLMGTTSFYYPSRKTKKLEISIQSDYLS